jgi:hypothetical protein
MVTEEPELIFKNKYSLSPLIVFPLPLMVNVFIALLSIVPLVSVISDFMFTVSVSYVLFVNALYNVLKSFTYLSICVIILK